MNYDAAGELTNIMEKTAGNLPIAFFTTTWNNAGEIQWEFTGPLPHANGVATRTMTYDDDNRLATVNGSSVTMDLEGNMTYGPLTVGGFSNYVYDARNRLLSAGGVTNAYDALDNRAGQTQGTNVTTFVINPNAGLPQVLMRIKNGVTDYYIYGPGLLYQITETVAATNTLTYHYDYRGSTVALTDDSGNVADRFEYSLYATMTYRSGTDDVPFLFNGRYGVQTDGNGLLYMRARYYNPYLCRFINPDPIGFSGGMNFYAYADGNPVSLMDPFGLSSVGHALNQIALGVGDFAGGLWNAISPWGDADKTLDALFDAPLHPILTTEALANGVENTFAAFGTGLGSGNLEKATEAALGIFTMAIPELRIAKFGETGEALNVSRAATWQEHEAMVTQTLRDSATSDTTIGSQVTMDVFNNATGDSVTIRIDNTIKSPTDVQLVDAKFSSTKDLADANVDLSSTVTANQGPAFDWIKNGNATVVPRGPNARAAGFTPNQPIIVNPNVQIHVNSQNGIVIRNY